MAKVQNFFPGVFSSQDNSETRLLLPKRRRIDTPKGHAMDGTLDFSDWLLATQRLATQRLAAQRLTAQRLAAQRLTAQHLAAQRLAAQRLLVAQFSILWIVRSEVISRL